jgi:hypothetical protein
MTLTGGAAFAPLRPFLDPCPRIFDMTDLSQPLDAAAIWAQIQQQDTNRDRLTAECLPRNKAAIFAVLAAAGVTIVIVVFDGYGDSGQIDSIDARSGETVVELPTTEIDFEDIAHGGATTEIHRLIVADAIEALAYRLLYETHGGWENNDGAYGEFTLDVTAQTIALDHNSRFTDVETFEHRW